MNLIIGADGRVRGVFGEEIDLAALGTQQDHSGEPCRAG